MHTSEVDTILRLKNGKFEVRKTLARGQWGASRMMPVESTGTPTRQRSSSISSRRCISRRTRRCCGSRGSYETLDTGDLNTTWPIRPTRGVNRGYQDGVLRPDGTLSAFTAVSAPTVYRGDRLPAELYGNVFLVEPAGNLVSRIVVTDDGTTLRGKKAYERGEFIASTDERFRPVNLSSAPDGTLYMVDMYHGIIQHKGYITEYLRDQILSRKLDQPQGHGRIYRIVHETTKRDRRPALSKMSPERLVDLLAHPNGWWRDTAQRMLVERGDKSVAKLLAERAERAPDWRTRLHALWTLDGIDALEPETVQKALNDESRDVRASALRLSERWLADPNSPIQAAVLKKLDDNDWAVRRQLAATLGVLPSDSPAKLTAVTTLLQRSADDPITVDAALTGLAGAEQLVLERLLASPAVAPGSSSSAITLLAATIVKSGEDARVQQVLQWTGDANRLDWQRTALLEGAEAALLGAPLPGTGRRGGGNGRAGAAAAAAGGNAAGSRGGPGGAPAFPRTELGVPAAAPAAGRGRANMAAMPLTREPVALSQLASAGDETGKRAAALLARLTWPGKPVEAGAAPAAAPLTPEEMKRFEAGKTLYTTLCMACHQENGQGLDKVAPPLAGSTFLLAAPHVPERILINGKEGSTGLMPPLGGVLTDDQIAEVLTYVRRSWGNQGSAVEAAGVTDVRKETTGRTRPWTEKELLELVGK